MADLSSLMQIAPTTAAGFMGINQRNDEIMDALRQQELSQLMTNRAGEESRKTAMHPFELEKARLGNETTSAQLPGVIADSDSKRLKAKREGATYQSDVDATLSENAMKTYKAIGSHLGSMSNELEKVPDINKPAVFAEALKKMGLPESAQRQFMDRYGRYSPSELVRVMRADSERILRENEAYVRTMDQQRLQEAGANSRNAATNSNQVKIEQMRIDAGKYDRNRTATTLSNALLKVRNAAQAAELYSIAADEARQAGDTEAEKLYMQRAQDARQRAAEDAANRGLARPDVDPNQFGIGTTPRPAANAPIAGAPGAQAQPPNPNQPKTLADLQKLYPGVPPEKLKEAFKKKFGVDLK